MPRTGKTTGPIKRIRSAFQRSGKAFTGTVTRGIRPQSESERMLEEASKAMRSAKVMKDKKG